MSRFHNIRASVSADQPTSTSKPPTLPVSPSLTIVRASGLDWVVIGSGTNLIVADDGFRGICLRLTSDRISADGTTVQVECGATLQALVDFTVARGLKGLETMTGIPGSVGAAIYGNAGAYGHSIQERVRTVHFLDGESIREFTNADCQFHYRESIFKSNKQWIILSPRSGWKPATPLRSKKRPIAS